MTEIHGKILAHQEVNGGINSYQQLNGELNDDVKDRLYRDYNLLRNKPSIEDVTLVGNKTLTDFGISYVYSGNTEYWNSQPSLITTDKAVYIYTDYREDENGRYVPGIKIGDGMGYLIDAPFLDGTYYDHILNTVIHVTQQDRDRWDEKVRVCINPSNTENLIFTTSSSKGE